MPEEKKESQFKALASGLSEQQQAEFFKILHETGVSPKDSELVKLLHALQLYKAYYETIPESVQRIITEIERIRKEAEGFSRDAHQSADNGAQLAGQVIQETERFRKEIGQINEGMEKGVGQWSAKLASQTSELLKAETEKVLVLPLQNNFKELAGASEIFGKAIAQSQQAVALLRNNVKIIRRAHLWTYGLSGIVIACALVLSCWSYFRYSYKEQLEQERTALVGQVDKNRAVLLELARFHRTLDLMKDPGHPNRKLVVMKDASGWQAPGKLAVIEFNGGD